CFFFLFFFQADDGIRFFHVTGVQTCALPIYFLLKIFFFLPLTAIFFLLFCLRYKFLLLLHCFSAFCLKNYLLRLLFCIFISIFKIGRASCRERVYYPCVASSSKIAVVRYNRN